MRAMSSVRVNQPFPVLHYRAPTTVTGTFFSTMCGGVRCSSSSCCDTVHWRRKNKTKRAIKGDDPMEDLIWIDDLASSSWWIGATDEVTWT